MRRTNWGSVISPWTRRRPPQLGHCNTSTEKNRAAGSPNLRVASSRRAVRPVPAVNDAARVHSGTGRWRPVPAPLTPQRWHSTAAASPQSVATRKKTAPHSARWTAALLRHRAACCAGRRASVLNHRENVERRQFRGVPGQKSSADRGTKSRPLRLLLTEGKKTQRRRRFPQHRGPRWPLRLRAPFRKGG